MSHRRREKRALTKPRIGVGLAVFILLLIIAAWWSGYFIGVAGQAVYRWLYWR